ncbi:MAG: hypothetical protein QGI24_06885 [Kiritimatiellia bacterium]|nr:hypothetical protein [Kiritimatiellia bacterium]MDP6848498.1 hypothetical protein [Kiritimatiellia bacterium]
MEHSSSQTSLRTLYIMALSVLLAVPSAGRAEETPSCAVLTFAHGTGVSPSESVLLTRKYCDALDVLETYQLMSYRQMNGSLTKSGFGSTRYSSNLERAIAAGRLLAVDFLVFGTAYSDANGSYLNSSLLDVRSGQRIKAVVTSARGGMEDMASLIATDNIRALLGGDADQQQLPAPVPAPRTGRQEIPMYQPGPDRSAVDYSDEPGPKTAVMRTGEGGRWDFLPDVRGIQLPSLGGIPEDLRFELAASITRIRDREMTEKGGLDNKSVFKHYRVSSDRFLLDADVILMDRLRVRGTLGVADLELHSSEGSTWEFDAAFAYGISAEALLYRLPNAPVSFFASVGYLAFNADDGSLTGVDEPDHHFVGWDEIDVDWSEIGFSVWTRYEVTEDCRMDAGARVIKVSGDESGSGGGVSASGDLDEDDSFGLFTALEYDILDRLRTKLQVNFVDSTELRVALQYEL